MRSLQKILSRYGLSASEVKAYLYLAGAGERKAAEISQTITLHRTETYNVLRNLEKKGLVLTVLGKPVRFVAVPPYRAVDHLLEVEKTRTKLLEKEKTDFLALWSTIPKTITDDLNAREAMQIVDSKPQVIQKAKELLKKTSQIARIFAPDRYLTILAQGDFPDQLKRRSYDVHIDLLVENSLKSRIFCQEIGWADHRHCQRSAKRLPCFIISDDRELLMIYRKNQANQRDMIPGSKITGLWTNCPALTASMNALFSELSDSGKETSEDKAGLLQTERSWDSEETT